jgi:SAM-dependent methyltransferase
MDDLRTDQGHWDRVYEERGPDQVSWFETTPRASLELIERAGVDPGAALIDVGGGSSRLAGELLDRGYSDLTVADVSARALALARAELDERADRVSWVVADVRSHDFGRSFELWHDRALFHFMIEPGDRLRYMETMRRSLNPDGHLILATFGPEGPPTCSGLQVHRFSAEDLVALLPDFQLATSRYEVHQTPRGKEQQFLFTRFVRSGRAVADADIGTY